VRDVYVRGARAKIGRVRVVDGGASKRDGWARAELDVVRANARRNRTRPRGPGLMRAFVTQGVGTRSARARASRGSRSLGRSTIGDDAMNYKYFSPTIFARRWRVCWVTTAMRLVKASARTEGIFERNGATTASGAVKMSVIPSVRTLVAR
jgi:hypothetical protein